MTRRSSMMLFSVVSSVLVATAAPVQAADVLPSPLRSDDVVAWTRVHRAEIVAAKAKASALAQTPKVVSALPDPMVMVSLDHLPFNLMGVDASLLVQQDFPLSGVLGKKKLSAEAEAKGASVDVERVALEAEVEALGAYLMVVESERMLVVVDEQITVAKQIVEATLAKLESGGGSAAEVVRTRLDVARFEGERKAILAEQVAAKGMLNAALGRTTEANVPTTSLTVPGSDPPAVPKLVEAAIGKRPELAVMKLKLEKAQADIDVMKSMYKPMAFVRTGPAYTMDAGAGVMLMLGVSVPIYREKLSAGVAEASQMTSMVEAETAAMRRMIEGEVAGARGAVVAAKIRFDTAHDKLVPASRQAVTLTLASYATGQAPLVSVLDAVSMLWMTRMDEVASEIRLAAAWVRLGRSIGVAKVGVP